MDPAEIEAAILGLYEESGYVSVLVASGALSLEQGIGAIKQIAQQTFRDLAVRAAIEDAFADVQRVGGLRAK